MIERIAQYAVPALAIGVAALVMLGPGRPRPALGARVWGLSSGQGHAVALRIELLRRALGVDDPAPVDDLSVELSAGGEVLGRFDGSTGPDGIAEAVVQSAAAFPAEIDVRVCHGDTLLAEGHIARRPVDPLVLEPGTVAGVASGELVISVDAARGVMAAPFPEKVRLSVLPPDGMGAAAAKVALEVSLVGGEVEPAHVVLDAKGQATVRITPQAHQVELSVSATAASGKAGHWEGTLPVVPGAIWLDPARLAQENADFVLISPVPRDRAYLSIITEEGRTFGAIIPLGRDALGFFSGSVKPPSSFNGVKAAQAVVAGDPFEQGSGTVAWPLVPPEGKASPRRIELIGDGMAAAQAREQARASRVRRGGLYLVGATALFEVLWLVLLSRASQRRLEAHLRRASVSAPSSLDPQADTSASLSVADQVKLLQSARQHPLLSLAVLAALVLLAFAMVGALSAFR